MLANDDVGVLGHREFVCETIYGVGAQPIEYIPHNKVRKNVSGLGPRIGPPFFSHSPHKTCSAKGFHRGTSFLWTFGQLTFALIKIKYIDPNPFTIKTIPISMTLVLSRSDNPQEKTIPARYDGLDKGCCSFADGNGNTSMSLGTEDVALESCHLPEESPVGHNFKLDYSIGKEWDGDPDETFGDHIRTGHSLVY